MTFVYDILVNLNSTLIDFYDWNSEDDFLHIRKVPILRVGTSDMGVFTYNKFKVNEEVLDLIKDKTQVFKGRNIDIINYGCVFSDGISAVMVEFNNKGVSLRKSKFLVNEEEEILDLAMSIKNSNVNYSVLNKSKINNMIRCDKEMLINILNELLLIKDDKEKIDYLYYEWFNKCDGSNKYESLVSSLKKSFTPKHLEMLELINLMNMKKQV